MENKKLNNPEAFPVLDPNGSFWNPGMTLRDYFAAKAMQAHWSNESVSDIKVVAEMSYKLADAMLIEREIERVDG